MSKRIDPPEAHRAAFILTVWSERPPEPPTWRGYLEAADGRRRYFLSLDSLNQLLREASGWTDPECPAPGGSS